MGALILDTGDYKVGKTIFACTFPKPLLLINFDNGFASVKTTKDKTGKRIVEDIDQIADVKFYKEKIASLDFRTTMGGTTAPAHTREALEVLNDYNKVMTAVANGAFPPEEPIKFKTMVIDSLTSMFRMWKEAILAMNNISSLRIPDYGTLESQLFSVFIPGMKALINEGILDYIILIDHIQMDKDEITGTIQEFPIGPSQNQGRALGKEFDEIYRQVVESGDKYLLRTKGKVGFLQVGSRHNVPDRTEAHFKNIEQYLK